MRRDTGMERTRADILVPPKKRQRNGRADR
ncbi:hypothetical protein THEMA_05335 [Thermotoga maritima MSB8]|nr:hypothetical protein THEMA_05335 [Thermotoga maritima MSB8]